MIFYRQPVLFLFLSGNVGVIQILWLPRSFAVASQNWRNATKIAKRVSGAELLLTAIAKFNAAFKSRSQLKLQCSHLNTLSDKDRDSLTVPHLLQVLELGNHLSTMIKDEPYNSHLYSNCLLNS